LSEAFLRESGRDTQIGNYKWDFNVIEDEKMVNT
jgi:hypothetical protein